MPEPAVSANSSGLFSRKVLARVGFSIAILLACLEAGAFFGHTLTMNSLQEQIAAEERTRSAPNLNRLAIRGWVWRSSTEGQRFQIITLSWPSVVNQYALHLRLDRDGKILEFSTVKKLSEPDQSELPRPPVMAIIPVAGDVFGLRTLRTPTPPLLREVVRQALLLSVRDEFQRLAPDIVFQEAIPTSESGENWPFEIEVAQTKTELSARIWRITPNQRVLIFDQHVEASPAKRLEIAVVQAENWSVTEFPAALAKTGFVRKPQRALGASTPVPEKVLQLASALDPISQFAVLRSLHQQLGRETDSPEVRTALARSYALLGSLTELNWSVAHKAFKAQALLAAQRAVRQWPADPAVWWSRAFVYALCGLHQPALLDIRHARELGNSAAPDWSAEIEAFCSWNEPKLTELASGSRFARYLKLLALEMAGNEMEPGAMAHALWQEDRSSVRGGSAGGVSAFISVLPELVSNAPDLPQNVQAALADYPAELQAAAGRFNPLQANLQGDQLEELSLDWPARLVQCLRDSGTVEQDQQQPSWAVLAGLIDDVLFMRVVTRLDQESGFQDLDPVEYIERARLLVRNHPLVDLLDGFSRQPTKSGRFVNFGPRLRELEFSNGAISLSGVSWWALQNFDLIGTIRRQHDNVVPELAAVIRESLAPVVKGPPYEILKQLAPDCPLVATTEVEVEWNRIAPNAREWERRYADNPSVLRRLAQQYDGAKRFDDEERTLLQLIKISPEPSSYWPLIELHRKRDDWEPEKQALRGLAELHGPGLDSAQAASQLAYGLMNRGEWEEARHFAELAAASGSAWGLTCGAECLEGLREWGPAEGLIRACSENYDNAHHGWYLWCRRTGHGDAAEAIQVAEQSLLRVNTEGEDEINLRRAVFRWLEGDLAGAWDLFQELAHDHPDNTYYGLFTAILAHQMGNAAERDKLLGTVADKEFHEGGPYLARAILRARKPGAKPPSTDELDWYLGLNLSEGATSNYLWFTAKCLQMLGDNDRALAWLERCASSPNRENYTVTLAGHELVGLGREPPLRRGHELDVSLRKAVDLIREGLEQRQKGDGKAALAKYLEALAVAPNWLYAHYPVGLGLQRAGRTVEADREFSHLIDRLPNVPELYALRGKTSEDRRDYRAAIRDYEAGLVVDPDLRLLHNNLGWLLAACPKDEIRNGQKALEHAEKARGRYWEDWWIEFGLLAAASAELGRFEDAIKYQERARSHARGPDLKTATDRLEKYKKHQPYRRPSD